jgi:DNA-binding transcriptional MerR regulator
MSMPTGRDRYLRLSTAARLARLPSSRVRHYVQTGLVQPAHVEAGHVLFGETELARLRKIRRLGRDLGLSPAGVEVVLRLLDELELLRAELGKKDGIPGDSWQQSRA